MKFVAMPRYLMRRNALSKLFRNEECTGKRLLEIGYGAGEIFNLYHELGLDIEGYDFSEVAYEYAQTHYADSGVALLKNKSDISGGVQLCGCM